MNNTNILPYKERQHGQIYYCKYGSSDYLFQWDEKRKNAWNIFKGPSENSYKGPNSRGSFNEDWEAERDQILREATEEERQIFIKKIRDKLIPYLINYQIY